MTNGPTTPQGYAPPPFPAPPHQGYGQPPRRNSNKWIIIVVLLVIGLPAMLVVLGAITFFALAVREVPEEFEQPPAPVAHAEPEISGPQEVLQTEQWKCIRVIDGDTIEVQHISNSDWVERVRLLCIDTPEKGKPGYDEATKALEKLVLRKQIVTELDPQHDKRDRFGRLLAYVILEEPVEEGVPESGGITNVNVEMVKLGHSAYYTKYGASSMFDAEFLAAAEAR